jgi:hypothetical protein
LIGIAGREDTSESNGCHESLGRLSGLTAGDDLPNPDLVAMMVKGRGNFGDD